MHPGFIALQVTDAVACQNGDVTALLCDLLKASAQKAVFDQVTHRLVAGVTMVKMQKQPRGSVGDTNIQNRRGMFRRPQPKGLQHPP